MGEAKCSKIVVATRLGGSRVNSGTRSPPAQELLLGLLPCPLACALLPGSGRTGTAGYSWCFPPDLHRGSGGGGVLVGGGGACVGRQPPEQRKAVGGSAAAAAHCAAAVSARARCLHTCD